MEAAEAQEPLEVGFQGLARARAIGRGRGRGLLLQADLVVGQFTDGKIPPPILVGIEVGIGVRFGF